MGFSILRSVPGRIIGVTEGFLGTFQVHQDRSSEFQGFNIVGNDRQDPIDTGFGFEQTVARGPCGMGSVELDIQFRRTEILGRRRRDGQKGENDISGDARHEPQDSNNHSPCGFLP